jgi:hypothetical protein
VKFSIHDIYKVVSSRFRKRRIHRFREVLRPTADTRILDVGGYPWFWLDAPVTARITLLNPHVIPGLSERFSDRFEFVVGDGCFLNYQDKTFDIVFSNSVIEHVGTYERQRAFASEARRVGVSLWIQTPARTFFMEPHLLTPFIHFLPQSLQRKLLRYFTTWGVITKPTTAQVEDFLKEVRLLNYREMTELFPDCEIHRERFIGLTKSYIAVRQASRRFNN